MKSPVSLVLVAVLAFASGAVLAAAPPRTYGDDDVVISGVTCAKAACDTPSFSPTLPIGTTPPPNDKCSNYDAPNPPVRVARDKLGPINIAGGAIGSGGYTAHIKGHQRLVPAPPGTPIVSVLVERCTTYKATGEKRFAWQIVQIPTNYQITVHTQRTTEP